MRHEVVVVMDPIAAIKPAKDSTLAMLLEAIRTLEEGIVDSPGDVDLGVVLGLGFPAARDGILAWCDAEGPSRILDRLAALDAPGPSFQPRSMSPSRCPDLAMSAITGAAN